MLMNFTVYVPRNTRNKYRDRSIEVIDIDNPNRVYPEQYKAVTIQEYKRICQELRKTPNIEYKVRRHDRVNIECTKSTESVDIFLNISGR